MKLTRRSIALAVIGCAAGLALVGGIVVGQQGPPARPPSGPPTMSPEQRARVFRTGTPWDGSSQHGRWSRADLEAFADYPLFYLGENFEGYNLTAVRREKYEPGPGFPESLRTDTVVFTYGDCVVPPEGRCPIPVSVSIERACKTRPEEVSNLVRVGQPETVRGGAIMQRITDASVVLWTDGVTIVIHTDGERSVGTAVHQLRSVGRAKGVAPTAGAPLAPPDFSTCPPPTRGRTVTPSPATPHP